jgi:predicted MFS family arabinose efflux permease
MQDQQVALATVGTTLATLNHAKRPRSRTLSPTAAFYLQASLVVSFLAGSSAATPLYAIYQAAWGFSPITITVVFGIYAIAVLVALLTTGSLSDHVGRKPVLFAAIAMQMVAMIVFATAGGVDALIAARVLQGLATGAASSALGAGLLDIDRAKGTMANAISPMTGTATGALGASLLVQFLPAPTVLVYVVLLAVFVAQGIGVAMMTESVEPKPGALASLRPHVAVPAAARAAMLAVAPALVAIWAVVGFYGSLGPALARAIAQSHSRLLGGLALAALAASGVVTVLVAHQRDARALQRRGGLALIAGVATVLASIAAGSIAMFFIGTIATGAGFGAVFQGALRRVLPLARAHERAGLVSIVYVICYISMGVPAVIAGIAVVSCGSITLAAYGYGIAVIVLAAIALALIDRETDRETARETDRGSDAA